MFNSRYQIVTRFRAALLFALLAWAGLNAFGERGVPAQQGVANFGRVSDGLFRGAQPSGPALTNLAWLGIKSIINLRMPTEATREEELAARAQGIVYTNVPLAGTGRPTDDQVRLALRLIETLPKPVFVHCKHGADRTGLIVACYRIEHDKWSNDAALKEAVTYGMSRFERQMKNFVLSFGKRRPFVTEK
jgi:protein tyrosine/serine phosphatase